MQSQRRARPRRPCVTHVDASKIVEGRPAGKQSKAVESRAQAICRPDGGPGRKQNMEQQAARLVEGPQSNAASRPSGGSAGRPSSAMQQQAAI